MATIKMLAPANYSTLNVGDVLELDRLFPEVEGSECTLTIELKDDNGLAGTLRAFGLPVTSLYAVRFSDHEPLTWEPGNVE